MQNKKANKAVAMAVAQSAGHVESRVTYTQDNAPPMAVGVVCILLGSFPFLAGLHLIPTNPHNVHCPYIVLAAIGFAFVGSGVLLILQRFKHIAVAVLSQIIAFATVGSFLTPFVWLAFFNPKMELIARILFGGMVGIFVLIFLGAMFIAIKQGISAWRSNTSS